MKNKIKGGGIVKAAGIVSIGTLFSRITGLIRLQIIAYLFGYSPATDAFWLAFTLPNTLRALLAEGALSAAFIPVFSEWCSKKGEKEAWRLANNIFNLLFIFVSFIVIVGIISAPFYLPYFAVGFRKNPYQMNLAIHLTQLMWPFLIFISLAAIVMAILNCKGHFTYPAFAPVFFNICFIALAFLLASKFGIYSLAIGVVTGGILQLLIQIPSLNKKGFKYELILSLKNEGIIRIFQLLLPAVLGSITLQVSIIITRIFASTLPAGSISGLQYAMRLIQFPLGLFPIALSTVIFPKLSSLVAKGNEGEVKRMINIGIKLVFFLLIPSSVGMIMLRKQLISILFQHGAFSYQDTLITSGALFYYSLGLFAMGGVMILSRAFYSLQDVTTPFKISLATLGLNVILNFILIGPLKHMGLALATSLSMIFNMGVLGFFLRKKIGKIGGRSILTSFIKIVFISTIMGGEIYALSVFFASGSSFLSQILYILLSLISGIGIVAGMSYLLKVEEFKFILSSLKKS